jgi:hypothetical protein
MVLRSEALLLAFLGGNSWAFRQMLGFINQGLINPEQGKVK